VVSGALIDMHGSVDIHVHSSPDLFPRIGDDLAVVEHAASLGLRAVSLKCHSERTTSRAYLAQRVIDRVQVIGGIVLNRPVGGLNPSAVEAALNLGAKHVWMPTVDAAYHAQVFGATGAYDKQRSSTANDGDVGIAIVDRDGRLRPEVFDVLDLVAQHSAILGTCHLSPAEIEVLIPAARERGVEKITLTHPFFKVPGLGIDDVKRHIANGAYAEFGYCTVSPMWNHAPLTAVVAAIKAIGPSRAILMSDAGQRHNPMPAECLRVFAQCVFESGISENDIDLMIKTNPSELLGLEHEPVSAVTEPARFGPYGSARPLSPDVSG
jgi:hypothetical protein